MSLLPGRILPQTEPFGTVSEDGKTVIIDKNWWLWAYNVSLQSIGTGTGIPADQLIDLESVDIDAAGVSAAVLNAPIAALASLMPTESDPIPSIQDVKNALLLAYSALDAVDAIVSGFATPTAKVGLTAIAGTALTATRSDGAPALDQTIIPTMTGLWTFNGKVVVAAPASGVALSVTNVGSNAGNPAALFTCTTAAGFCTLHSNGTNTVSGTGFNSGNEFQVGTFGSFKLQLVVNNVVAADFTVAASPACTFKGPVGVNNLSPPAQVTGWGVPTGPAVVANFSGTAATTAQIQSAIAKIITDLKAFGIYGA